MTVPDAQRWQRISPLLDELLDLDADAQRRRLAELRAGDSELADELGALLEDAQDAHHVGFLDGLAAEAASPDAEPPSLAGRRIGAYVLESPLGQGGSGAVWRARRADGRFTGHVALKLLHLSLLGQTGASRFEREGSILSRLSHPHIARLLDAGVASGGQPYLVLELVEGKPIDQYCDERRLRINDRVTLCRVVLEAVAHAHRHLVIHSDLKPGNVLVSADGSVKLLDFGIAKLLQPELPSDALTREGGRPLTPEYAAPEQLRGEAITTATDVYALGVVLYQLLTGRHPMASAKSTAAGLMQATLHTDPSRLSAAVTAGGAASRDEAARIADERDTSLPRLLKQLGGDLENIVAKALRKSPAERYASVDAFSEDLRRWSAGEPVTARADSLAYRTRRFIGRHRGAVTASALVGAAIVAGIVGTIVEARRAEEQAQQAKTERDNAVRDLAFADGARELLGFLVSQGNSEALTASQLLARAEEMTNRQFADDPLTRGRLQQMLGIEYGNVMDYAKSKAVLMQAQAAAHAASDPSLLSNVDCLLAASLGDQSEVKPALAMFDDAIRREQAMTEPDNSVLAACLHMRADLHAQIGRPDRMLADAQAALAYLGAPRPDQRVMANSIRVLVAEAYGRLGRTAEALTAYEGSLADLESLGRAQSARTAVRYNNFSRMLYAAGQPRRAEEMASRGLVIARSEKAGSELEAILEGNRARALVELGRFDEAKSLSEHALASADRRQDGRWAGVFALYGAPAWCGTGDTAQCAGLLDVARDRLGKTLPPTHSNFGVVELEAARLALIRQDPVPAREHLLAALKTFDAASDRNPLRIRTLDLLAMAELKRGDAAAAANYATLALTQAREAARGLAGSEWLGEALLTDAEIQQDRKNPGEIEAEAKEAAIQMQAALGPDAPRTKDALASSRRWGAAASAGR